MSESAQIDWNALIQGNTAGFLASLQATADQYRTFPVPGEDGQTCAVALVGVSVIRQQGPGVFQVHPHDDQAEAQGCYAALVMTYEAASSDNPVAALMAAMGGAPAALPVGMYV